MPEIQDGRQDGHHCQMKINLLINSHIISSSNTFSTIFGMRNHFLGLFLQFKIKNKIQKSIFGAILVLFINIYETPINSKFLSLDLASHIQSHF